MRWNKNVIKKNENENENENEQTKESDDSEINEQKYYEDDLWGPVGFFIEANQ